MTQPEGSQRNGGENDFATADADADAILAELEAEEDTDISALRAQRAAEIHASSGSKSTTTTVKPDVFVTLTSDDDTLRFTTEHEKAIVHFFHPDFARCSIMNEHLSVIAQCHADYGIDAAGGEVKFARVDVKHAEFVVQKLGIRVLPCVIGFIQGQVMGRVVGFEGVSWGGNEKGLAVTRAVEERFIEWEILKRALVKLRGEDESESEDEGKTKMGRRGIQGRKRNVNDDDDDDWD